MPLARNIFGPEHEAYRETCRTFVDKHIVPNNEQWAKDGIVDRELWRGTGRQGLLGIAVEERYGSGGLDDFRFNAILDEKLARGRGGGLRRHDRDHERDHRP